MDYLMLVNKENEIKKSYYEEIVFPSLEAAKTFKNNDMVYKVFQIEDKTTYLERETRSQFMKLRDYAGAHGIYLGITCGFLTLKQQKIKYDYFFNKYGKAFTEKSACLPGYSEHNTGLALDCDIFRNGKWAGIAINDDGTINSETQWLHSNIHKFGFILRYPKGKEHTTKMKFEPWHLRFLGSLSICEEIYAKNLTLEEYHKQKIR